MAGRTPQDKIRCSFCNKTQDMVRKMISGQDGAYICDECISLCTEILEEELEDDEEEAEISQCLIELTWMAWILVFANEDKRPRHIGNLADNL